MMENEGLWDISTRLIAQNKEAYMALAATMPQKGGDVVPTITQDQDLKRTSEMCREAEGDIAVVRVSGSRESLKRLREK